MEAAGDKMATTHADPSNTVPHPPAPKRGKHGKPVAMARFGSASVPIYRCDSGGRVRFALSHYRDGKRLRQFFTTLEAAKKEGQFVAQRIQAGMQHVTDLKPHERDHYAKAVELLGLTDHRGAGGPVVQHRAQRRPVGDDLSVGPPRPGRYPAGVRGVNAPFNPRANGKNPCLTEVYQTRNGFARAGHTAIPPAPSTCSYVQLRGKSMAEEEAYPAKTTTSNPQGWSDALSSELTDHGD